MCQSSSLPGEDPSLEEQDVGGSGFATGIWGLIFSGLDTLGPGRHTSSDQRGNGRPYNGEVFTTPLANPMFGSFSQDSGCDGRGGVPGGCSRRPGGDGGRTGRGGACGHAAIGIVWGPILPGARPSMVAQGRHVGCRVSRPRARSDPLGGEFAPCLRPTMPSAR